MDHFGDDFFADVDAVARAVRDRSSVNIFHNPTSIKVDLFVADDSVLDRSQLARRSRVRQQNSDARLGIDRATLLVIPQVG